MSPHTCLNGTAERDDLSAVRPGSGFTSRVNDPNSCGIHSLAGGDRNEFGAAPATSLGTEGKTPTHGTTPGVEMHTLSRERDKKEEKKITGPTGALTQWQREIRLDTLNIKTCFHSNKKVLVTTLEFHSCVSTGNRGKTMLYNLLSYTEFHT